MPTDWRKKILVVSDLVKGAPAALDKAIDASDGLRTSTVRIAVTGLSQAGKTVFLTSLIHNLLGAALGHPRARNRMPMFKAAAEGRLLGASVQGAGAQKLPQFPYKANIARMAAMPPEWPNGTTEITETEIELKFAPKGWLSARRVIGGLIGGSATLKLKLIDYPGEWLLDLPLLRQSYAEWSRAVVALSRQGVRAELARHWLTFIASHQHDETASEETAKQGHDLYRAFLLEARLRFGLCYLQPGRFICPGMPAGSEPPYFWFCPLDIPVGVEKARAGSLAALMEARFDAYRKETVEAFFRDHFRHFNRQIVLVDVLRVLLAGRDAFEDARLALEDIMKVYQFGSGGWLASLFGSSIDRVLFAATKADHVTQTQRDHLAQLLSNMTAMPALQARSGSATTMVLPIASVLCTEDDTEVIGGHEVDVVVGRPVGKEKRIKFFPGQVPIKPPRGDAWKATYMDVPRFEPPVLDATPVDGVPHINLDAALEFLIGDKLA